MTDSTTPTSGTGPNLGSTADDTFAWTEPETDATSTGASTTDSKAREWLTQLQAMIENLATQAAPVVRDIGAKAAELAAIAGEKAGPVAQRAADLTGQAGSKLAERSRDLAADLRRDAAAAKAANATDEAAAGFEATADSDTSDEPTPTSVA
jgi:hypothetical protein